MSRKKKFRFNLIVLIVLIILLLESLIANIINRTYAASIPQKYDLRSEIPIVVKISTRMRHVYICLDLLH